MNLDEFDLANPDNALTTGDLADTAIPAPPQLGTEIPQEMALPSTLTPIGNGEPEVTTPPITKHPVASMFNFKSAKKDDKGNTIFNPDGSATMDNGAKLFRDGHIEYQWGGKIFAAANPWDTPRDVTPTKTPAENKQVVTNSATGEQWILNKATGEKEPINFPESPQLAPEVSAEDAMKGMPQGDQDKIKGYAEYRLPVSPYGVSRDKTFQRLLPYIMKVNPNFNAAEYRQRQETLSDYGTKGKTGQNIGSFNMVINHLGHLEEVSKQLGGTKPLSWNQLVQVGQRQLGDPTLASYRTSALAVEQEFARMLKNGATDQKEIDEWRDRLSPSNPPEAREAAFRDMISILKGRLDSVSGNYERVMGKSPKGLIFPEAQSVLSRHGWNVNDEAAPPDATPTPTPTPAPKSVAPNIAFQEAQRILADTSSSPDDRAKAERTLAILRAKSITQ